MQLHPEAATPLVGASIPWTSGGDTLQTPVDESVYYVSLLIQTEYRLHSIHADKQGIKLHGTHALWGSEI